MVKRAVPMREDSRVDDFFIKATSFAEGGAHTSDCSKPDVQIGAGAHGPEWAKRSGAADIGLSVARDFIKAHVNG